MTDEDEKMNGAPARRYLTAQQANPAVTRPPREFAIAFARRMSYVSGGAVDPDTVLAEIDKVGTYTVPDLPHQEAASHAFLSNFVSRIEDAYRRLGYEPLPETVIGTLETSDWNAFSADFFKSTALVVLHRSALVFCQLLAKATAPSIARQNGEYLDIGVSPEGPDAIAAAQRVAELARALAHNHTPNDAPPYIPPRGWPYWELAIDLLDGFEMFVVAHEYAHLMEAHQGPFVEIEWEDGPRRPDNILAEFRADALAQLTLSADERLGSNGIGLLAPLVFMKFLDLMTGEGLLGAPQEHPSARERLAALHYGLLELPVAPEHRKALAETAVLGFDVQEALEAVWTLARERFGFVDGARR